MNPEYDAVVVLSGGVKEDKTLPPNNWRRLLIVTSDFHNSEITIEQLLEKLKTL